MKSTIRWYFVPVILGIVLSPLTIALAQTYTATLTGNIIDAQGAAVPNAKVTATNQATKLDFTAESSDSGVYTIPFLPAGKYVVTVEGSGFKKLVSNEITLEVNQVARVNLQLQVGAVSEVVNIGCGPSTAN